MLRKRRGNRNPTQTPCMEETLILAALVNRESEVVRNLSSKRERFLTLCGSVEGISNFNSIFLNEGKCQKPHQAEA